MPEISRFFGIVIRMYYLDHPPPHIHVSYSGRDAVLQLDTLEVVRGSLPRRAHLLVVEWALGCRPQLMANWHRAEKGEQVMAIDPLE